MPRPTKSSRWKSERWKLRRGNLFLTPGDSPLGLRLPIASLPHIEADEYPYIVEQDPLEPREELPVYDGAAPADAAPHQEVQEQQLRGGGVRTAMSIEIRDGILCAFMPPVEKLEDYLELVTAVEATAEEMQMQVHVEGYPPPFDPRVEVIKVTPDPGVIEINIQPAQNWREAVDITFGPVRRCRADAARRQQVSGRRPPHRHRRRQSCRGRRLHARGLAVPAPSGFAEEPRAVLAAASVAVLSVLRHVHRADQPGAAHRRGPP